MFNHLTHTHNYEKGNVEIHHPDGHRHPNGHSHQPGHSQLHGPPVDKKEESQTNKSLTLSLCVDQPGLEPGTSRLVNFSFKTISEIEEGLGIEVFQAAAMEV